MPAPPPGSTPSTPDQPDDRPGTGAGEALSDYTGVWAVRASEPAAVITVRPAVPARDDLSTATDGPGTGTALVVAVAGEIDAADAQALIDAVREACRHASLVVIDLDAVTYFGSGGLAALTAARRLGTQTSTAVVAVVRAGHRRVRRVLAMTGLDQEMPIHRDLDTALATPH